MIKQLQKWIEEADVITIFRHTNPDLDALGSQFGLKTWLQENYPDKDVYVCGLESKVDYEMDDISDETISKSLAFALDTPTLERLDDQRFKMAKQKVKIDHHIPLEIFADLEFIDKTKAATCEYVPYILEQIKPGGFSIHSATFFYKGILTDTLSFRTNNMTPTNFEIARLLTATGINIGQVSRDVWDIDLNTFNFITFLRTKLQFIEEKIGYVILEESDVEPFEMSMNRARSFVAEFGNIKELQVWAIFTPSDEGQGTYTGSLRSKEIDLNSIANQYHGGGHKNACGVKRVSKEDIKELLHKIEEKCS